MRCEEFCTFAQLWRVLAASEDGIVVERPASGGSSGGAKSSLRAAPSVDQWRFSRHFASCADKGARRVATPMKKSRHIADHNT